MIEPDLISNASLPCRVFTQQRALALADYDRHGRPARLLRRLSLAADEIVLHLAQKTNLSNDILLIAIGGYGRGELFPQSDLDLLFLCIDPDRVDAVAESVAAFTTLLWDRGLRVSGSLRSRCACLADAHQDVSTHTAFLESRLLRGAALQFHDFQKALLGISTLRDFFSKKLLERKRRQARYSTLSHLRQPDCKNGRGGLRDIHGIFWIARAAGWRPGWSDLWRQGLLTAAELRALRCGEILLNRVRIELHRLANRPCDRILVIYRERVAANCGFSSTSEHSAGKRLLEHYHRATHTIEQITSAVLDRMQSEAMCWMSDGVRLHPAYSRLRIPQALQRREGFSKAPGPYSSKGVGGASEPIAGGSS